MVNVHFICFAHSVQVRTENDIFHPFIQMHSQCMY